MRAQTCLDAFEICSVDREALERAVALPGNDFEDNVQIACAELAALEYIITRDPEDFVSARTSVLTPAAALSKL